MKISRGDSQRITSQPYGMLLSTEILESRDMQEDEDSIDNGPQGPSAKTYLASGTPLLRQDTRYSNFAPLTLGEPRAGLPHSLAPGESGGTLAIQPYPRRYWLHNLTPHAS